MIDIFREEINLIKRHTTDNWEIQDRYADVLLKTDITIENINLFTILIRLGYSSTYNFKYCNYQVDILDRNREIQYKTLCYSNSEEILDIIGDLKNYFSDIRKEINKVLSVD